MRVLGRELSEQEIQQMERLGLNRLSLKFRMESGWKWEDALTVPKYHSPTWHMAGHVLTYDLIKQAIQNNLTYSIVYKRLKRGWGVRQAVRTPKRS